MRKFQTVSASAQSSHAPASGVRGAIDSLVQGSLVDLFGAYSVAVAPLPRSSRPWIPTLPDISAAVSFTRQPSGGQPGRLTLSLSGPLLEHMSPHTGGTLKGDWARELANQLMGRIKNRLLPFNVRLQMGVSSMLDSVKLERHLQLARDARVYTARTLRSETVVTIEGLPDDSQLMYIGPVNAAAEGDAILF